MAVWLDLVKRLEETLYIDGRLHAECVYRGGVLPSWLSVPLKAAQDNAGARSAVLVLNVKGLAVGDTLCVMRLRDLEALTKGTRP